MKSRIEHRHVPQPPPDEVVVVEMSRAEAQLLRDLAYAGPVFDGERAILAVFPDINGVPRDEFLRPLYFAP